MKLRVAVCTAHSPDYAPLAALTVPTMQHYADKHGYDFIYINDLDPKQGDRVKIELYKSLYEKGEHDVYLWIDTDAMIMNSDVTIENFTTWHDLEERAHFIWGADPAGPNSGVFLARFTPEAHMFLHQSLLRSAEMGWADQVGMIQLSLVHPHRDVVKCINGKYINAYPYHLYGWDKYAWVGNYEPGCFVLHLPGMSMEKRVEVFQQYMGQAK